MATGHPTVSDTEFKSVKPGYWVGNCGSVLSGRFGRLRVMRPTPQHRGHLMVCLGHRDCRYVHRLVLEAFVGPCPEGMECRHLNGNPSDNRLENLAWGTQRENYEDSIRHGTAYLVPGRMAKRGEDCPSSKLTESVVRDIMRIRNETGWGEKRIARALGLPEEWRGAIRGVYIGQSWNHVTGLPPYRPFNRQRARKAS